MYIGDNAVLVLGSASTTNIASIGTSVHPQIEGGSPQEEHQRSVGLLSWFECVNLVLNMLPVLVLVVVIVF